MENSNRNDMKNSEDTRRDYESPATNLTRVKMEGYLCGSATIKNPENKPGEIDAHEVNGDFNVEGSSNNTNGWDVSNDWSSAQ